MFAWHLGRVNLHFFGTLLLLTFLTPVDRVNAQTSGEDVFTTYCAACHSVGGGRRVGPDLKDAHKRKSEKWIHGFIKNPQGVIGSGDKYATDLFNEYGKLMMPSLPLSDTQIDAVISYIKAESGGEAPKAAAAKVDTSAADAPVGESREVTEADVAAGQDMFQGKIRFKNGGPACNSCHHVQNDAVIGGGVLAKELTSVFSTMGGVGVMAVLGRPPFPVMEAAYKNRVLTDEEIFKLVSFLQHADSQKAYQQPKDYGFGLFVSGLIGAFILLMIYQVIWRGRKKKSVNQEIFDRQVRSTTDW